MNANIKQIDSLVNHLLRHNNPTQMENALRELLTANELSEIVNRLEILKMLKQGVPQRRIADELGVGIATVTRGSNALKQRKQ